MIVRQKSLYAMVIIAVMIACIGPIKALAFSGTGDGLDEGTAYLITNCSQLQEIRDDLGAWYRLANDIDCSETAAWNSGAGFEPLGNLSTQFHGVLRGDNHTITGLTINRPGTDYVGLFGLMGSSGSVDRLRLKNVSIVGRDYVGGIAGGTSAADIFNTGVYGDVTGASYVGGAVGYNAGFMTNVHAHVAIGGNPTTAGGLIGYNDTFIISNYSTGFVPAGVDNGGAIGFITDTGVTNTFWDTETSGQATSAAGTGLTTAQLKAQDLNSGGSFWGSNPLLNNGYPYLIDQTPDVPETFITAMPADPTNNPNLTFEFASNVSQTTFECKLDAAAYEPCTSPYTTTTVADGAHSFLIKAINSDGIVDQSPASTTLIVDTVTPSTSLSMIDPPIGRNTAVYEFSSEDPSATFECSLNDASYEPCTSPYTTPVLTNGQHTVRVRATDAAGNVENPSASDTFYASIDVDGDSSPDATEDAGPNNGDANNDGTADAEQANVFSAPNSYVDDAYQVLQTDCSSISNIVTGDPDYEDDADYTYPMGLNDFQVACPDPGMTARITMYNYGVTYTAGYVLRKEAFVNGANTYDTIDGYQLSNPTIGGQSVTKVEYDLVDGGPLDLDGLVDGNIYDPVGLALSVNAAPTTESSNPALAGTGQNAPVLLLISALLVLIPAGVLIANRKQA